MKTIIAKSFDEFFAKHAETLEPNNDKAENADPVATYIENALSHEDDEFDDEDAYDFDPVAEDDEPTPGPRL